MEILKSPTVTDVQRVISSEYPYCVVSSIEELANGHSNYVYLVNSSLIFRFPRTRADDIDRELALLKALQGKITVPHPNPIFFGKECSFMGYERLEGVNPTRELYKDFSDSQKQALASDLAQFIYELEGSMSVHEAKSLGFRELELMNDEPEVLRAIMEKSALDTKVVDICLDYIQKYRLSALDPADSRVVHRDLVINNMLVDPSTGRLSAVLDFGNAGYGNRYLDFASVFRSNRNLGKGVVAEYNKTYTADISEHLTRVFSAIIEIHHLEKSAEHAEHDRALTRLSIWSRDMESRI